MLTVIFPPFTCDIIFIGCFLEFLNTNSGPPQETVASVLSGTYPVAKR